MNILTWNVKGISGLPQPRLEGIVARVASIEPDIVLLQEVGFVDEQPRRVAEGLAKSGLVHFHHGTPPGEQRSTLGRGWYGSAIASRWPMTSLPDQWIMSESPRDLFPHFLARATVDVGGRSIEVISAHIPNGSGYGWKKVEHFEALAEALKRLRGRSVIVGGDFNEPRYERPNGRWICWGEHQRADGTWGHWDDWTFQGVRDTGARWDAAVRSVLADENIGGLVDACRKIKGPSAVETTHIVRGQPRFFDHVLVSPDFVIEEIGFEHAWREEGWSDHSGVWARVRGSDPRARVRDPV